ncbi:hypothetical protein GCM10009760_63620 [Kitasatospora kazusensis]|uniref:Type I-E CRISPR-associated protein Cas6/Cse3/CasE n=1 Tax=Kitasatospora kazusensis TaxID=407974 RepID=A0ABN1ZMF8_9ACTN
MDGEEVYGAIPASAGRTAWTLRPDLRGWSDPRERGADHLVGDVRRGPTGARRIGADADSTTLSVRMLPPVTTDHHKGLKITRAELRGTLTVTDPGTFVATLTEGLGRGRAYSCGLLLTRPT